MKTILFSVLALTITTSSFAAARADRMQPLMDKLLRVEQQLNPSDLQALDYYLGGIEAILNRYDSGSRLVCASNGQHGSFERFTITDINTGATFGQETTLQGCNDAISSQKNGLLCVSNGQYGSFERFGLLDTVTKKNLEGYTTLDNCKTVVSRSRPAFVCVSNSQSGSFERFTLYNRSQDRFFGGETNLQQCLSMIQ